MTVILTGGTGLVGQALSKALIKQNYRLHILSRSVKKSSTDISYFLWPKKENPFCEDILPKQGAYGVIHLAGEPVSVWPWINKNKNKIYSSRVDGTKKLIKFLQKQPQPPMFFISASATGVYGDSKDEITEQSPILKQDLFLQKVCLDWEKESLKAQSICNTVIFRFGMVLSYQKGFLYQQNQWIKRGFLPCVFSKKKYWLSWIALNDLVALILWAIKKQEVQGIYNAVSPQPVTLNTFFKILKKQKTKKSFLISLPIPLFLMRFLGGEVIKNLMMNSKVLPAKAVSQGFTFKQANLDSVL